MPVVACVLLTKHLPLDPLYIRKRKTVIIYYFFILISGIPDAYYTRTRTYWLKLAIRSTIPEQSCHPKKRTPMDNLTNA